MNIICNNKLFYYLSLQLSMSVGDNGEAKAYTQFWARAMNPKVNATMLLVILQF
jgi:hypothetical protein